MKALNPKPQPKFVRTSERQHLKPRPEFILQTPQLISSHLKFQSNVINWNVSFTPKNESHLQYFLFTNEKSIAINEFTLANNSSQQKSLSKFLQYSPSVVRSPARREQQNASDEMLLDDIEDYSNFTKKRITSSNIFNYKINNSQKKTTDQEKEGAGLELKQLCTAFETVQVETRTIAQNCIRIVSISQDRFIFKVNYSIQSTGQIRVDERLHLFKGQCEKLIKRMKRFFIKYPLKLFNFYRNVLTKNRPFLLLKFNSQEILQMQQHIGNSLRTTKPECILQYLFMNSKQFIGDDSSRFQ